MPSPLINYQIKLISCQGVVMFEKYAALFGLMVSLSLVFLLAMYDLGERINKSRLYAKYIRLVIIALATLVGCLLLNYVFIASCR